MFVKNFFHGLFCFYYNDSDYHEKVESTMKFIFKTKNTNFYQFDFNGLLCVNYQIISFTWL